MLRELSEQEFNNFARSNDNSIFFESPYWGKLKKGTGWNYYLVGLVEDSKIKGASLLLYKKIPLFKRYIFYSPRGFLIDYNNLSMVDKFTKEIITFIKKNKGIFIKINPLISYQERDIDGNIVENGINNKDLVNHLKDLGFKHTGFTTSYGKDLEPRWISVLDIKGKTIKDIEANLRGQTRRDINNSYKQGLTLTEIDTKRMDEFKHLMEHTGERRGFIDRPLSYYNKMYETFSKTNDIKVMLVEMNIDETIKCYLENKKVLEEKLNREKQNIKKKEGYIRELSDQIKIIDEKIIKNKEIKEKNGAKFVVAGGLFMTYGNQVVSLFGASYKQFMGFKGQYFLNFEMIKYAIDNGYEKYNFYGITGEFSENSPMFGLFDFKRGFNATVIELIGEFTLITSKFYFQIYSLMLNLYIFLKRFIKI